MKTKYHVIPVIVYAPVDDYPDASNVHEAIKLPLNMESPRLIPFIAEDFEDSIIEIDRSKEMFSGCILLDCKKVGE